MPCRDRVGLVIVAALALVLPAVAVAESAPDNDNGRYTFSPTPDGVLRLDTRSGEMAACTRSQSGGWACMAMPDERAALDAEIGRLSAENVRLKEALAKADQLKPDADKRSRAQSHIEIPLPSDGDVERAMSFLENVWRRLVEMAARVREDVAGRI